MAGLGDQLTAQSLGSSKTFNWTWFIELVTCGILVVWFIFYFNRLFATIVSAALRTYTWHKFRVYVDIQSLQISLLGGRLFFKGVRYHGENETVYIHSGHLTWRYWLQGVRQVNLSEPEPLDKSGSKSNSLSSPRSCEDLEGHVHPTSQQHRSQQQGDARIAVFITGLEWFIYNRTPVYNSIIHTSEETANYDGSPQASRAAAAFTKVVENKLKRKSVQRGSTPDPDVAQKDDTSEKQTVPKEFSPGLLSSTSIDDRQSVSTGELTERQAEVSSAHSLILRFFPVGIECSRGAVSLGNEHTKALIVTTFDKARGYINASGCAPADIYKQVFDFDIEHPHIQMRPNPDYNLPQMTTAERIIAGTDAVLKRKPWWRINFHFRRRKRNIVQKLRSLLPGSNRSVESFHGDSGNIKNTKAYESFVEAQPDGREWHGLDRYMDEDDGDDHQAWLNIEYARFSTILDCPSIHLNFYWDTPGNVKAEHLDEAYSGLAKDINGIRGPAYGLDLTVRGGTVNYGPWTDRLRAELQTIFLPSGYKTVEPTARLVVGNFRQSSTMLIRVDVEEEMTMRVPVRENSKDWRWRGRATAVRDAAALRKQQERRHFRFRRGAKRRLGPEIRPFGWFSVAVGAGSKVRYEMDMVPGKNGYHNDLKLDLLSSRAISSVNHTTLWECEKQVVSADLSNPLGWNDLHTWRFDISNHAMNLYLLRDHTFLLIDLINDFTAGQKSDYMTFMPFQYQIGIDFKDLKLFLNANDYNIIDNPCETDDNAFLILGFDALAGRVGIPMKYFSPAENHVSFQGHGNNASLMLKTPLWSTLRTFAESEIMANLKTLELDGIYNYHAGTSPNLTDSLFMNIVGGYPKFHLQGFLIRYFMNVKENYFGEHVHFSTLEEYQSNLDSDNRYNGESKKAPVKKQNDLDVILSVRADRASALMPANIYERSENLRLDILLVEADMRFTNYYMDLQVSSSPIEVATETEARALEKSANTVTNCQLFIDGVTVYGHRLFGAPPTEPTYVCNWDFDIGRVTGECSSDFLRIAMAAVQAFIFTLDDDENALPKFELMVPDVTFLRARVEGVRVWLVSSGTAFLVELAPARVNLNDWSNAHFSKNIQVYAPMLMLAAVEAQTAYRQRDQFNQKVPTLACLKASMKIAALNKRADFAQYRALQQQHVRYHDQRTHRADWLLHKHVHKPFATGQSSWSRQPPAMPVPGMPDPVNTSENLKNSSHAIQRKSGTTKLNSFISARSTSRGRSSGPQSRRMLSSQAQISSQPVQDSAMPSNLSGLVAGGGKSSAARVAFSTPWAAPLFPLQHLQPDVTLMPPQVEISDNNFNMDPADDQIGEESVDQDERIKHDGIFCNFTKGITGFCSPQFFIAVMDLLDETAPKGTASVLDSIQRKTVSNIKALYVEEVSQITDLAFRLPFAHIRMVNQQIPNNDELGLDQYDARVEQVKLSIRLIPQHAKAVTTNARPTQILLYTAANSITIDVSESISQRKTLRSNGLVCLRDVGLWLSLQDTVRARTQVNSFDMETTGKSIDSLAAFIERTTLMVDGIVGKVQSINQDQTTLRIIHCLTAEKNISDPVFLSRPSYVLRTANEHVRLSNAWKILSRLRNNQAHISSNKQSSQEFPKQTIKGDDMKAMKQHVTACFDQWKTWDDSDSTDDPILAAIFGSSHAPPNSRRTEDDVELEVLLGQAVLIVDRGPRQSMLRLHSLDLNFSEGLTLADDRAWTFRDRQRQRRTLQSYVGDIFLHLDWELLELVENLVTKMSSHPPTALGNKHKVDSGELPITALQLTLVLGSDRISAQVDTPNLRMLLGAERLKNSITLSYPEPSTLQTAILLTSNSARLRLESRSKTLVSWKLSLPTIYGDYQSGNDVLEQQNAAKVAATCRKLRFDMKEDILGFLKVAGYVIQEEVKAIQNLSATIKRSASPKSKPHSDSQMTIPNIHVAFLLSDYSLNFRIAQFLRYKISGNTARTSVIPRSASRFTVNIDLKDSHHTLVSSKASTSGATSTLVMPPVNGIISSGVLPNKISIDMHAAVESILLEASAIRACLDAIYRPEVIEYLRQVKAGFAETQNLVVEQFPPSQEPKQKHESAISSRSVEYRSHVILAGLGIHCVAPVLRDGQDYEASLKLHLKQTTLKLYNTNPASHVPFQLPQFELALRQISLDLERNSKLGRNAGQFSMDLKAVGTTELQDDGMEVQKFQVLTNGIRLDLHEETAALATDIAAFLQKRLKAYTDVEESQKFRPLRRLTLSAPQVSKIEKTNQESGEDDAATNILLTSAYALDIRAIRVRWILDPVTAVSPGRLPHDLVFSIARIDLRTKREGSARLAIVNMQLQTSPKSSTNPVERSANSALLPEMVFNAAYVSSKRDRRFAFKAAGKAVDIRLAADFIIPASALQKSLARASTEIRGIRGSLQKANPESSQTQLPRFLGKKRLASLLIYADFAGAVITVTPRKEEQPTSAFGILKGSKRSRAGRYGQAVQSGNAEEATLRAPGIALQVEYKDIGAGDPALSTELKVAASSNTLAPSVVPLLLEISSSVTDVMGQDDVASTSEKQQTQDPPSKTTYSESIMNNTDPTAVLGRVKLNAGLWIQRQEFSLTCQPIARVSATAKFDDIFVNVSTVQAAEQDRFFSIMTTFRNLSASVQHVYSRESTASFEVKTIVMSLMNSRHFSDRSGISAILNVSPMKAELNAKQMQDFLLFREIWYPAELRQPSENPAPAVEIHGSQLNAIQRYQEITATAALPWHAIISVQELKVQIDFGQSIGKSNFAISKLWASSKKSSDSEQNLCIGFDRVGIDSSGRMSGFVELQGFRIRAAIRWPRNETAVKAPLVQGSVAFEHLRSKLAFDYQPFAVADISSFEFVMYNVRHQKDGDRLVGSLDGGKVQVFCTTAAAAQGLSIWQAFERLVQEKQEAHQNSLLELDRYLRRKSNFPSGTWASIPTSGETKSKAVIQPSESTRLHTDMIITLKTINIGAFPSTFFDQQILKIEAVDVQARFAVGQSNSKTHSGLGMSLGQVRVALASVNKPAAKALGEVSVTEIIDRAATSKGGTILKVPRLVASMETWQRSQSNVIEYIFRSTFQGKVDVGWNYSRISFIRGMWDSHSRALAHRLGKPLPPSAVKITAEPQGNGAGGSGQEKITAVVNMPQSKYEYVPLQPPIIDTPQLRDLGEATPSLEWIGLHREKLPNVTHSVIIVTLLQLAKEVEDSYDRILGLG